MGARWVDGVCLQSVADTTREGLPMQDGYHRIPDDPHTLWGIDMSYMYSGQTICHLSAWLASK